MQDPSVVLESLPPDEQDAIRRTVSGYRKRFESSRGPWSSQSLLLACREVPECSSDQARTTLLEHLVATDIELRRERGDVPQPDDYRSLFPNAGSLIAKLFAGFETIGPGGCETINERTGFESPPPAMTGIAASDGRSPTGASSEPVTEQSAVETLAPDELSGSPASSDHAPIDGTSTEIGDNATDQATLDEMPGTAAGMTSQAATTSGPGTSGSTVVSTAAAADTWGETLTEGAATLDQSPSTAGRSTAAGTAPPSTSASATASGQRTTVGSSRSALSGDGQIRSGQTLGDYELLSPLGQGGMGMVYLARQKAANRLVALKVIRPDKLGDLSSSKRRRAIERFRAEAQAAARLQHDNLVTVYEVGEIDGCHYFSMQFVRGGSLSGKLNDGPLSNRQAATYIEPICRAVHAAHQQGILHRDIKPPNILIEDETDRPRIADFGLAKLMDEQVELTHAGEAMGTPPYMPPEQFRNAAAATAQSDVYSLGATLYHLLSGRPPFQASSSIATMRQVLDEEPVPLRQLNSEVDRDLETLCMKCLEKEPQRRFQTAAELADELKRYLDGRPILSRPLSRPERAWRWCRRNPIVSGLSGLAGSSVVIAVISLAVTYVKTEQARVAVANSLVDTQKAQALSEASFQDALSAVNEFFTRVSEDRLLNEPGAQNLRRELLELARAYYLGFLERRRDDPTVQDELARAHFRVGLIVEELDSPSAALESLETARKLQAALLTSQPDDDAVQRDLSRTINAIARVETALGNLDNAEQLFREARELRQQLVDRTEDPTERLEFDRLLANTDMNLGLLDKNRGNFDAAWQLMDDAQKQRLAALPVDPQNRTLRRDIAKGWYNLANLSIDQQDVQGLETNARNAVEQLQTLLQEDPADLNDRYLLALCWQMLGDLHAALVPTDTGRVGQAVEAYSQARMAFEDLTRRNPAVPSYRANLARLLGVIGQFEAQLQHYDTAEALLRQAETLLATLAEELSDDPEYPPLLQTTRDMLTELARIRAAADAK